MLAWDDFDTLFLDLDGTLLDLAFDNRFWRTSVPEAYAQIRGLDLETAREMLSPMFRSCEGTLDWYCVHYWTRMLQVDIVALKEAMASEVAWLPGARQFLERARARGKRLVLLTNAHPETLKIKDQRTGVVDLLDRAHSSHHFGVPKEHGRFWSALGEVETFDPARTLFVDDSIPVLRAARAAGLRHVRAVRRPDTSRPEREIEEFDSVSGVASLFE
jgi:putative hydrolase of the HAD superfamily